MEAYDVRGAERFSVMLADGATADARRLGARRLPVLVPAEAAGTAGAAAAQREQQGKHAQVRVITSELERQGQPHL